MALHPEAWPRVRDVFEAALALPEDKRAAYVAASCDGVPDLQAEVERMLASHEQAGAFLEQPAVSFEADSTTHLAGRWVGPYFVSSRVGAGGMGEVYKARDTRLDRTVALKVLASHVARDLLSRQRFEIEARAVASLTHPHICTLYDIGHQPAAGTEPSFDYLVMEYLEGETLAARLVKGPLPPAFAIRVAIQIASACDRAHRAGIVHRDLKPGNVMLTKSGAKLLDFGLAKPSLAQAGPNAAMQATHLTTPGIIVGTLHYLAPEQIEGRSAADARTDIFAFGSLLFEMLTAQKAFAGGSQGAVISAILEDSPKALSTMLPQPPAMLEYVLQRCLAKDPDDRWQSARDVMFALEGLGTAATAMATVAEPLSRPRRTTWLPWGMVATLAAALVTALTWRTSPSVPAAHVSRLSIPPPEQTTFIGGYAAPHFALSPDGRRLAFVPTPIGGRTLLWIRDLDSLTARVLTGTDGATYPFWSPDGRSIGFFADGKLKTIDSSGGMSQAIADAPDARGGAWGQGVIVFAPQLDGPLYCVSSNGGQPMAVTTLNQTRQEASHRLPSFLPDGRQFLFLIQSGRPENSTIHIGSVDSAEMHPLHVRASKAIYAAGFLVFGRERSLMAQRFDVRTRQLSGEPVALGDQITFRSAVYGDSLFSVAGDGTLAYWNGGPSVTRLDWYDRGGKPRGTLGKAGDYLSLALSPDERTIAVEEVDPGTQVGDIWTIDVDTGISSRLTIDPGWDFGPIWSPDGRGIVFGSIRGGRQSLYRAAALSNGADQLVLTSLDALGPSDWSLQAGPIILQNMTKFKIGLVEPGKEVSPTVAFPSPFAEADGHLSPDGRWLAYTSNESGTWDVYVRSFPAGDSKWRISPDGGFRPMWRDDGRELYYMTPDQTLMATPVRAGAEFAGGVPKRMFQVRTVPVPPTQPRRQYAVASKGDRFLVNTVVVPPTPIPITIVLNWPAALK